MKPSIKFLLFVLVFLIIPIFISAQSIEVHYFIGKSRNDVIKKFGNPVHKDESNPDMICMFYKSKTGTMIFVSNSKNVYQAEATQAYNTESDARTNLDAFISSSTKNGFTVDTISTADYQLLKKGCKANLQYYENKIDKNYELRVKASKTEN